jgi:type IV pilus assembly protein PilA
MFSSAINRLNDRRDAVGEVGEDAGFTLIELMVVLLILAILLAIAIPTFLGVTKSANDRATQSNLNTALVNAKSIFQNNSQSYALTGTANSTYLSTNNLSMQGSLSAAEPNLSFTTAAVSALGSTAAAVGVAIAQDGNGVVLTQQSKGTANCWYVVDNAVAETAVLGGATYGAMPAAALAAGTWYGKLPAPNTTCSPIPPAGVVFQASGFSS